MSNYNDRITQWAVGDTKAVIRHVGDLPPGVTVQSAAIYFKTDDDVDDSAATVTKAITTSATSAGVVTNSGSVGTLRFQMSAADSEALGGEVPYRFYVRMLLSNGEPNTPYIGTVRLVK